MINCKLCLEQFENNAHPIYLQLLKEMPVTDDLKDTINYAAINSIIHEEMKIPSKLMEHVVGRIMTRIKDHFPRISFIAIKMTKTSPPMQGEMVGVSVAFEKKF